MPAAKIIQFPTQKQQDAKPKKQRMIPRKDGLFQKELRFKDENGKPDRKVFYGTTQAEAKQKLNAFKRDLEAGLRVSQLGKTVDQWGKEWLKTHKADVEPNSYAAYVGDVNLLVDTLGIEKRVKDVVLTDVQQVLNLRSGMSKSTIKRTYNTLFSLFESARKDRIILYNPCDDLKEPEGTEDTHRALEHWEMDLICDMPHTHRGWIFSMLMLFAGLRRGEACALDWETDIDWEYKKIIVNKSLRFEGGRCVIAPPKTKAGYRRIPIVKPLYNALLAVKKDKGPIVASAKGKCLTQIAFDRLWDSVNYRLSVAYNGGKYYRWVKEEDRPNYKFVNIRCHDLRHTYCTMLYEANVDIKTAQRLMGHSNASTTLKIYTHLSEMKAAGSLASFEKYLEKNEFSSTASKTASKPKVFRLKTL